MISFAATPQAKEAQQARAYTDPSAGAPPSRRSGSSAPYVDRDHWNKVFTDPAYFDSIAKNKGMAEGAKVSLHGDDYVYRQAMISYLAATRNVPLDDMRSIFDAEKDGFAKKVLGKQTASAREMFDWQKQQFERSNEKKAAADQILQGVIRRSLEDALSGGDTPFVESVGKDIDAASEMFDDEEKSRLWEKAEELDMKIRAAQDRFAPEARFIFDALQQSTGQKTGFGAPDMREMAARFAKLPDAQRRAIYELAGGFAQLTQTDKGFWYQMAESLGRGASDIVERVPRNFREQTLRGQLRLLNGQQPVFRAAGVGGAEFSAAGSTPVFGATQGQMLTPEEREEAKAKIEADLGILKVERELRDLAERVVDPIQTIGVLPEIIEEGLYGAARSIPYTAAAAVPLAGIPAVASALFSANYDRIMVEYPDLDPDKAALIAAISAPIEAGLERMKVNTITGRLPVFGGLVKRLQHPNQRNLTRIMIGAGGVIVEQNIQETIQELTFPVVQTIAAALDADMPDYNWQERMANYPRELAVQFVALLPLSMMGVGALSYREIKRGENYLKSKADLEKMGYSPEQIDRITGAESAEAAQAALVEEHAKRDPKLVKAAAQRVVDEVLALREQSNPAALPRLEKQGADYVVLSPEGKELARTTDQTAAEQALVSARRETVQREMRDVHTGINEAVAFIQKVNEARQRGEDVAKVIREEAPRTLLDDYEANPTQENLDRLFETVRAFGQDINEPAELANFPVTGSNQGALREGIWRSIIRINEGADGTIVMREFAQDNLKRAIAEGRVTIDFVRQQLNDTLPQIDSDRMDRQLRTETDTDVIEAFSDVALAYFRGQIRDEQIPAGLRGIIRRLAIVTRDIFRRAYNLARLRAEGKLDRDFEALLAEAVGVDQQALVDRSREKTAQEVAPEVANYSIGLREPDAFRFNEQTLPNGNVRFIAYHGSEQALSEIQDQPIYVSSMSDGAGYGAPTRVIVEGKIVSENEIEAFAAKYGIAMEDLFHEEASMEQDLQEALRAEGYDGAMYYDQRRDDGEVVPAAIIVNPSAITIRESDDTTEAGTLAPDTDLTMLDPDQQQGEDWQDIPWEQSEKNYSIAPAVLPEAFPVLDKALYDQILAETDTTAAIHIDRLRVGEYEGVMLQGGMYFPAIVENLKQGVVWAFNSKGVASAVAERARANGGYVKLVLMLEGNVIGNKTFATIWFKQLRKNIKAGKITTEQALAEINAIRERYVTRPVKGVTTKFTGHDKPFTTLKQAEKALMDMPQIKRGNSYFQKTSTVTKRDGEKMSYQSLLSQAMTAKGFPDAAKIVESIEEPAFKGLPKGTIVGLIKIDPDAVPMSAAEAGVTEHISYGYVLKGKPVARMAKHQSIDTLYPQISGKLMSQQAMDFPASQVLNYSIASKNSLRVRMTRQAMTDAALAQESWKDWYEEHQAVLEEFFGDYAQLFQDILSITSQAASVKANVGLALRAFGLYVRGEPFDGMLRGEEKRGFLPAVIKNLERHRENDQLQGQKIRAYKASNDGEVDQAVVDRHIAQLIFGVKSPSKAQFAKAQKILSEIANEIGWTPRQVQAALWAHSIYKSGKTPESYGDYLKKLESRGTIEQRIGDIGRRGAGGDADGGGRGRYAPDGAAEGAGVDNYSISTQSEIDRVGAALNRLDRDPLERVKIYEKAQEKFLRVMADNREMLAGMQDGDLAQMRRTQILQALGELDGIISVLPPEVRSKIGGYTQLAKVDPMDVFKGDQKVSEVSGMQGAIISAWMREGLNIGQAQKKTELPAGYRAERNLDPTRADRAIADVFIGRVERINRVLEKFLRDEYNDAAVELFKRAKPQRSGAGEKPKGKLGADVHDLFDTLKEATEWSAEEAQAWADGQWSRIENGELNPYEETHAMMAAQMVPLFADWANADSSQRAAAVTMGKDVLNRAYKGEQQRIIAQRTKRGYDRTDLSKDAGVSAEDDVARNQRVAKENSLPSKFESMMLNLLNFEQVLAYIFGENSAVARRMTNMQRKADNTKTDGVIKLSEDWAAFTSRLAGDAMSGEQLVYRLSEKTSKLDDYTFSQNELIAITMMWMQPKGRQHMEGFLDSDGQPAGKWHYGQDFVNKAERLLTPEAKAVREYLLAKYDAEYEAINKVYRKVYGLNLPKNQFYSPLVVESIKAPANMGIDPVTGAVFAAAANSPSALRSRGGAIAQPVFRDAVQTYLAHMMQMEHWKAYAEFNSEAAALLGHRDTRNVATAKAGEQATTVLNGWLTFFNQGGNKEAASHLAITQFFNNMLGRASTMALFGRIGTLVIQTTQLGAAAAKMPVAAYMTRFAKLMSGQLGWGAALDSPYIQRRIKQMPPQVQVGMMGLRGDKPSKIREAARQVGWLISGMDGLFTAGTYAIVYDYQMAQLAKSGITGAEAESIAREEAERITDEVAQPTRSGARSLYELNASGPLARVIWAFSSEARKNLGLLLFSAAKRSKSDLARAALYVMVFNGVLATIIRSAIRDIRDGDDEELFDEKNWSAARLLGMVISEPLYGFPVVGEVFEKAIFSALGVYKPDGSLFDVQGAVPALKRIPSNLTDIMEGEADWRVIMRDTNRLLSATGLFNGTIAGAATLSNLAKDIFEATEANLPE
jgi:hypothetical protein